MFEAFWRRPPHKRPKRGVPQGPNGLVHGDHDLRRTFLGNADSEAGKLRDVILADVVREPPASDGGAGEKKTDEELLAELGGAAVAGQQDDFAGDIALSDSDDDSDDFDLDALGSKAYVCWPFVIRLASLC